MVSGEAYRCKAHRWVIPMLKKYGQLHLMPDAEGLWMVDKAPGHRVGEPWYCQKFMAHPPPPSPGTCVCVRGGVEGGEGVREETSCRA